jgi:hypothetical protein
VSLLLQKLLVTLTLVMVTPLWAAANATAAPHQLPDEAL